MKTQLDEVMKEQLKEGEKGTLVAHDIGGGLQRCFGRARMRSEWSDIFVSPFGLRQVMRTNTRQKGKRINEEIEAIIAPYNGVSSELKWRTLHEPLVDSRANGMYALSEIFKALKVEKYLVIANYDLFTTRTTSPVKKRWLLHFL